MSSPKPVTDVLRNDHLHWVGDGFPVRSLISMHDRPERISPFLLLDYAPPYQFPPTDEARGVDGHPHRGFETVTIVYQGGLEHRDSTGSGGTIGPGDVQWMTAGAGILHEEKHERDWAARGGTFQVAQLWVNLPGKDKLAPPGYQTLLADDIPIVDLPGDAGTLRVIAGEFNGTVGPARTFSPINVHDVRLAANHEVSFSFPADHNTLVAVFEGTVRFGDRTVEAGSVVLFGQEGTEVHATASTDALLLVLDGAPLPEPVVAHGPFVMTSRAEIERAVDDFRRGRMGTL